MLARSQVVLIILDRFPGMLYLYIYAGNIDRKKYIYTNAAFYLWMDALPCGWFVLLSVKGVRDPIPASFPVACFQ